MATLTTNYSFVKPTVGGDTGAWGVELNGSLDQIDTDLKAVSDVANAALPKAGGALTGRVDTKTATGAALAGSATLDLSLAQYFSETVAGATSFVFSNCPNPAGSFFGFILKVTNGGSAAITWPPSVKWAGGVAPVLTAAGIDLLSFLTDDGGVTYRGTVLGKDYR